MTAGTSFGAIPRPKVSVIIPTHGRPGQLRSAVASVLGQDYEGPIECIVTHDGEPADPTLESEAPNRVVRAVVNATHARGLPGARNAGLEHVTGQLVASLDDDDRWMPEKLRLQVDLLTSNPNVLVVASGVQLHTETGANRVRIPPARVTRSDLLAQRIPELHSSNLLMRPRIFELAGVYDEDVPIPEDYDWLLRLSRFTEILSVQAPLVWVDRSRSLGSGDRWAYRAQGREKLLSKHPELVRTPRAAASLYGRIAFAHAAAADRRSALKWMARGLRHRATEKWLVASAMVVAGVSPDWVQRMASKMGRSL